MVIEQREAEIVRWLFGSYLAGMNTCELAEAVTATGVPTSEGSTVWRKNAISYMLHNEKYIGDSLGQKSFTTDAFSFHAMDNHGEKPQYYAEGTHPAKAVCRTIAERYRDVPANALRFIFLSR